MKLFNLLDTTYSRFSDAVKSELSKTLTKHGDKYGNATIFGQLINVLVASVQNIMLYIEDALVEQNKYTAQRKKSIYNLATLSGYEPSLGKAASVQLLVNFVPNNSDSYNIVLKNHEKFTCTQNGLTYNAVLPQEAIVMAMDKMSSTRIIQAVQGRFEKQIFTSSGGKYYTINCQYNGNLDKDYIKVWVNNELWEPCEFYDMNPDGKQYKIKSSYLSGIDIIFGNDVHGRSLKYGDVIEIEYLVHDGVEGNLNTSETTFFIFDNMLYDTDGNEVDGNSVFNVSFASLDSVSSGTDSETKEQIRQMIGMNSRSLVLAAPEHYKTFINKFSFCGYNRTWSEKGSMIVNSLIMRNIKNDFNVGSDYFALSEDNFKLTDIQKQSILNCIENSGNQLGGVSYNIIDPVIRQYAAYMYITLSDKSKDREYIKNQIKVLVGDFFADLHSDIFIPKSDLIHLIKSNIQGIDSIDLYFLSKQNEEAIKTGSYESVTYKWNPSKNLYDINKEIVYLYDGQNPNLGLDEHGNILLSSNYEYPALVGGWSFNSDNEQLVHVIDPLTINIE